MLGVAQSVGGVGAVHTECEKPVDGWKARQGGESRNGEQDESSALSFGTRRPLARLCGLAGRKSSKT